MGHTLGMAEKPDHIVIHRVESCGRCERSLTSHPPDGVEKRQVHDLPPIALIVTEHEAEKKLCACGHATKADFPQGVSDIQ